MQVSEAAGVRWTLHPEAGLRTLHPVGTAKLAIIRHTAKYFSTCPFFRPSVSDYFCNFVIEIK